MDIIMKISVILIFLSHLSCGGLNTSEVNTIKKMTSLGSTLSDDSDECLRRFRKAKKIDLRKFSYDLNLSRC